jgi:hypothetical protein
VTCPTGGTREEVRRVATRKRIDYAVFGKNVALAFAAGFATSFGTIVAATPRNPGFAALVSAAGAAVYAGFRAAVGYAKGKFSDAAFTVDK